MQALILAAGRGSRLGSYSNGTPKCLLQVGAQRLIEHQLEALAEAGVAPIGMVVGYSGDEVQRVVGIRAEYIHNPRWETTNSIYSFWLAREWIDGPVVILNSDVLFHPEMLSRLLATGGDAIAYDSSSGNAPEHMKVRVLDGRLVDMSKDLSPSVVAGENVGLLYFRAETAKALAERAGAIIEAGGEKRWLGSALGELARTRDIRAVDVAGLSWGEIDSAVDLERVRARVWPVIQRTSGRPARRQRWLRGALLAATAAMVVFVGAGAAFYWREPPPEVPWETIAAPGAPTASLWVEGSPQQWSDLHAGNTLSVEVEGPGLLRIESRLVLPARPAQRVPYVVQVLLDGRLVDLFKKNATRQHGVAIDRARVAKRKRITIELPRGRHSLALSLLGADRALVRLLRPDVPDDDAESDGDGDADADGADEDELVATD